MNQENKIMCWRKMYAFLSKKEEITGLAKPEEMEELELVCQIGTIKAGYQLRLHKDILRIQAGIPCPGKSETEIMGFARELMKDLSKDISAYPVKGELRIVSRLVFSSLYEEEAGK